MCGYEIRQLLDSLGWLIGSPSCGSLYPALRRLLQDGWATVDVELRQARPPKKTYHVTKEGTRALRKWIDQPATPGSLRTFAMRLIVANCLSQSRLIAHLQQRRSNVAGHEADLAASAERLQEAAGYGRRLAHDYALALARAETAWLDSTLERLQT
jgi:DNA-binding PadR family transcriptional regulator